MTSRTICFVSDRTGLTSETLGHSLLTQFGEIQFRAVTMPFVESITQARGVVGRINDIAQRDGIRPIVLSTLVDDEIRAVIRSANAFFLDFFDACLGPLEVELGRPSAHVTGQMVREWQRDPARSARVYATEFTLANDDGAGQRDYRNAEVVLIGVSRSGKTPTCLYLAMQYGIRAANVPLVDEDFERGEVPRELRPHLGKLVGLTIQPDRLAQIRQERRPDSRYASAVQVEFEVRSAQQMLARIGVPSIDVSGLSVEEIASRVLDVKGLTRQIRT